MSANVHQLFAKAVDVDAAWRRYAAEAKRIADEPELLSDRAFMEMLARLELEWKRLFMAQEAAE
jgi:hypothetical protein